MYKRKPDGWLKHVDFIILDLLSMHLAFVIAFVIRQGAALPYADSFYRNIAIVLSLLYLVVIFLTQSHKGIMRSRECEACYLYCWLAFVLFIFYPDVKELFENYFFDYVGNSDRFDLSVSNSMERKN